MTNELLSPRGTGKTPVGKKVTSHLSTGHTYLQPYPPSMTRTFSVSPPARNEPLLLFLFVFVEWRCHSLSRSNFLYHWREKVSKSSWVVGEKGKGRDVLTNTPEVSCFQAFCLYLLQSFHPLQDDCRSGALSYHLDCMFFFWCRLSALS